MLDAKVDINLFEKVNHNKVSNREFEHFVLMSELLDRKLKHLSMMQVEISK